MNTELFQCFDQKFALSPVIFICQLRFFIFIQSFLFVAVLLKYLQE